MNDMLGGRYNAKIDAAGEEKKFELSFTFHCFWNEVKCTILATQMLAGAVDPDVGGLDFVFWHFQCQISV